MAKKKKNKKIDKHMSKNVSNHDYLAPIILVVVILVVLALFYFLTVFLLNRKEFEVAENHSIQYTKIIAGESFDKKDSEYLVFYYNMDEHDDYTDLVSSYREKEKHLPIYTVDMADGINKNFKAEEDNFVVEEVKELKIKDSAIIRFKNGEISNYTTSSFEEFLNNNVE